MFLLAATAFSLIVMRPTDRDAARPSPGPPFPTWPVRYADSLATQRGWSATTELAQNADCTFRDGRLEIDMRKGGIFRCQGQRDELTDFALRVDVYLLDGRACAGIWFRRQAHERRPGLRLPAEDLPRPNWCSGTTTPTGTSRTSDGSPSPRSRPACRSVVGLVVAADEIGLYLNDVFVGRDGDARYPDGRVALGIAVPREVGAGRIGFANIELRTP